MGHGVHVRASLCISGFVQKKIHLSIPLTPQRHKERALSLKSGPEQSSKLSFEMESLEQGYWGFYEADFRNNEYSSILELS